jgi:hypothetical protein
MSRETKKRETFVSLLIKLTTSYLMPSICIHIWNSLFPFVSIISINIYLSYLPLAIYKNINRAFSFPNCVQRNCDIALITWIVSSVTKNSFYGICSHIILYRSIIKWRSTCRVYIPSRKLPCV